MSTELAPQSRRARAVLVGVCIALAAVIVAPTLLSSQDLYGWGRTGLGLPPGWAWLVPVALDCAATSCVGMTIAAAIRRERPGAFGALVWVFAGASAFAQYRHGIAVRAAAPDAFWLFPSLALLGPVLLHVTLSRLRRWARQDQGEQAAGAAGFGARWLPGVAFRETMRAWAASRREGISGWRESVAYVRECTALRGLSGPDALRYAWSALGHRDIYPARVWLQARRVLVDQADIDAAVAALALAPVGVARSLPVPPAPAARVPAVAPQLGRVDNAGEPARPAGPLVPVPVSPAPIGAAGLDLSSAEYHSAQLGQCGSKADAARYALRVLGPDVRTAELVGWLDAHGWSDVSRSTIRDARASVAGALVDPSGEYPTVTPLRPRLVSGG